MEHEVIWFELLVTSSFSNSEETAIDAEEDFVDRYFFTHTFRIFVFSILFSG